MRFSTFSAIATFAVTALAQDLSAIPPCAMTCVGNGLASTGCSALDVKCICNSSTWISDLSCCVSKACQPSDQAAVIQFAQQICGPQGVAVPTVASCSSGSATPAASAAPAASSSAGAIESVAASASRAVSSSVRALASSARSATAASATGNAAAAPTAYAGLIAAGLLAAAF